MHTEPPSAGVQVCPVAQAGALPHMHIPVDEQLSATTPPSTLHGPAHVMPAGPQLLVDRVSQVVPEQQPLAHEVASHMHAPLTQCWLEEHSTVEPPHVHAPAVHPSAVMSHEPHARPTGPQNIVDGVLHIVPEQQPPGHEVASHLHAPPVHSSPIVHAVPPPQVQAPAMEHASPVPVAVQSTHVMPGAPHAVTDSEVHMDPTQQPSGQEVASQVHTPDKHS